VGSFSQALEDFLKAYAKEAPQGEVERLVRSAEALEREVSLLEDINDAHKRIIKSVSSVGQHLQALAQTTFDRP